MPNYAAPCSIIAGQRVTNTAGRVNVINPADGMVLGELPLLGAAEVELATQAAARGFEQWRRISPERRAEIVMAGCDLLRQRAEVIGELATLEGGKPLRDAVAEVHRSAAFIEWDVNEGRRLYGEVLPSPQGMHRYVLTEPIGVVAAFAPWNAPISSPARKIGAALGAGCAVIIKASEETPASAVALVECMLEAGVPGDALNLVFGDAAAISAQLIASPVVRALTFTGSVSVGKHLAALAGSYMKPVIMELGGHSPVVVCADADPVGVAREGARAKYRNAGQICTSPTRFIVHQSIYETFLDAFVAEARSIRVGNGLAPETEMGPLANDRRLEALRSLVEDATAKGAILAAGGRRVGEHGYFFEPTVLHSVPENARIASEEPFGPVAMISSFTDLNEAIASANRLPYGLAAFAFTDSAASADKLARSLECGILGINTFRTSSEETPFGGVKDSGYGREGGSKSLSGFVTHRMVNHVTGN
jgi:succinate-semialdehyde dehydrogenase/glutarate-semialdehyde dehydrogenase